METRFYVFRELHNGETGGIDYQKPDSFTDKDMAEKKYHEYLSTYIGYGKLDRVSVVLLDSFMNPLMSRVWVKEVPPVIEEEATE